MTHKNFLHKKRLSKKNAEFHDNFDQVKNLRNVLQIFQRIRYLRQILLFYTNLEFCGGTISKVILAHWANFERTSMKGLKKRKTSV
jgi:hypothetical protein